MEEGNGPNFVSVVAIANGAGLHDIQSFTENQSSHRRGKLSCHDGGSGVALYRYVIWMRELQQQQHDAYSLELDV